MAWHRFLEQMMAVTVYRPLRTRSLGRLPVRSITDIGSVMCEGIPVRVYSADGRRSIDVHGPHLLEAVNNCAVMAEACKLDFITLGDVLDQTERGLQSQSKYAITYVRDRIRDPYWRDMARHIVRLAPDGSGTREALRYVLSTTQPHNVLS